MSLLSSTRLYQLTFCDRRGKNVCTYFLLSSCKFGAPQCVYSHSTAYLPKKGWWTTEEKKDKIKAVMAIAEERKRAQRQLEWQMRELERGKRAKGKASAKKDRAEAQAQAPKDNVDTATGTTQKKKSTARRGKGKGKSKIKAKSTAVVMPDDKTASEVKADNDAPSVPFTDYNLASPVVPRPDALEVRCSLSSTLLFSQLLWTDGWEHSHSAPVLMMTHYNTQPTYFQISRIQHLTLSIPGAGRRSYQRRKILSLDSRSSTFGNYHQLTLNGEDVFTRGRENASSIWLDLKLSRHSLKFTASLWHIPKGAGTYYYQSTSHAEFNVTRTSQKSVKVLVNERE